MTPPARWPGRLRRKTGRPRVRRPRAHRERFSGPAKRPAVVCLVAPRPSWTSRFGGPFLPGSVDFRSCIDPPPLCAWPFSLPPRLRRAPLRYPDGAMKLRRTQRLDPTAPSVAFAIAPTSAARRAGSVRTKFKCPLQGRLYNAASRGSAPTLVCVFWEWWGHIISPGNRSCRSNGTKNRDVMRFCSA